MKHIVCGSKLIVRKGISYCRVCKMIVPSLPKNARLVPSTWRVVEQDVADKLQGRRTIGSGNIWHDKGDIKAKDYLIEVKSTKKKSISLKLSWLKKIEKEAIKIGKKPALVLDIQDNKYMLLKWEE